MCPNTQCSFLNRAFARFCRRCGEGLREESLHTIYSDTTFQNFSKVDLEDHFWTAPVHYRGYLWAVSVDGNVYRYSPGKAAADRVTYLGSDSGRVPFVIRDLPRPEGKGPNRPHLLALSPEAVFALDLFFPTVREIYRVSADARILSRLDEDWVSLEVCQDRVYFIERYGDDTLKLVSVDPVSGASNHVPINDQIVSGPFRFDSEIALYGRRKFHRLDASSGQLVTEDLPAGFEAAVGSQDLSDWEPIGRPAYVATHRGVYLPGRESQGKMQILLLASRHRELQKNKVDIQRDAAYSLDREGHLVVAERGQIRVINETRSIDTITLPDLIPMGEPFHDQGLVIALTRSKSRVESIVFKRKEFERLLPVSQIDQVFSKSDLAGFYRASTALMMAYRPENGSMRIVKWDT